MPLAAGQSDKLGNRYEGVWTVDSLLDVLIGDALSVTVEPIGDDARGIEFIKTRPDGHQQFHSAKRQTTGNLWSLHDLTAGGIDDSVLGPLWQKLQRHANSRVVFVSGTTANELNEIVEQASRCPDFAAFSEVLDQAQWRRKDFNKCLLSLCGGTEELALDCLKRTEVVGITERELIRRVEQRIRAELDRSDGTALDPHAARLVIADMVFDRFGQTISRPTLTEYLTNHGYRQRDLARDKDVLALIAIRNATYIRHVEAELIQGEQIERAEAKDAFAALTGHNAKSRVVIVGAAGLGKSCVVAQTVGLLERAEVPVIAVRLDIQTKALTSDSLGKELGFPASPAAVLSRIAANRRCVLVIDQMDALSFASGRNQHLWDAFDELLRDADSAKNMRVLLACRSFDAEHDTRLRRIVADEQGTLRINLGLFDVETVKQAVAKATGSAPPLTGTQLELLRTPLHLSLYLQGDPKGNSAFQTVQDLFARYWTRKRQLVTQQLGRDPKWTEVLNAVSKWLSDHQTLSAPLDIVDAWEQDTRVMASQCLLVIEGQTCRFFHEAFFDYAFARAFVSDGGMLCELLLSQGQEQHLFRRAQVRQVLAYRRGRDFVTYLQELRELLAHANVRFHIKKLVLDWLRSLGQPTADEWRILQAFDADPKLGKCIRLVPHNSPAWFGVLLEDGTWATWLDSKDEAVVTHAIWLLSLPNVMRVASDKIAGLVAPRLDGSDPWRMRFLNLASFGDVHYSRAMFDLFLRAFQAGWFDGAHEHWWHRFGDMPKENPGFACEFAAAFVGRLVEIAKDNNLFEPTEHRHGLPATFMHELENACPEALVRTLLPLVVNAVRRTEVTYGNGEVDDRLGAFSFLHEEHDFKAALFGSLQRAMEKLAAEKPEFLDEITGRYETMSHRTVAILLLSAWTANAVRYAEKAAAYLLENQNRLTLGYSMWTGGDGRYAITRAAIRVIAPHCSEQLYSRLEEAVLSFQPQHERKHTGPHGYLQLLLIEALPKARMSRRALGRFEHLANKFPRTDFSPPRPTERFIVPSPISREAMERMTDEHWLSAMRKYSPQRPRTPENWHKGDMHTLCSELVREAQADKPRFAALALRMPDDIAADYFAAILDGLAETHGALPDERTAKAAAPQPLDTATVLAVICRLHGLAGHPCGRTICSAFSHLAGRPWPDEAFDILTHYALHDDSPDKEMWQTPANGGTPYCGGDPEMAGLNSVRGGAAHAIARLLFQDKAIWPKVDKAVRGVAVDRSLAVRSMAVECLLALMNLDREEAIRLFLTLANGADAILGGSSVDRFLHHAAFKHYAQVRAILLAMLKSSSEHARATAARQIAVAAFHVEDAEQDLREALAGDEHCRASAANVFAHNLGYEAVRTTCRQHLLSLFDDDSKKVRDAAAACFRNLSSEQLTEERDLIYGFIRSRAFNDGFNQLSFALEHSTAFLPEVVCAIPERLVAQHIAEIPNEPLEQSHMVSGIPELVLRVYEQTHDAATKTRCLNVIDAMLELGFGSLESELQKVER